MHRDHAPEREIDAGRNSSGGLRHLVNPEALSLASHDQPKALTELKRDCLLCSAMAKLEAPRRTKRQAGDGRTIAKTGLVVAMPADAVAAISIEIEQNRIVRPARNCFARSRRR
jgi:hypothetical protein